MPLAPGTLLNNRYRINSILGQGGMGAVYRATDEHLSIAVAVKENLFLTEEYSLQFQREAHILAGLRHDNLPHVSDYFSLEHQGQYLVMNYIEGEDLRQRMERTGGLSEREVILIGISICEAIHYLHNRQPPVVHRDIKPGNIKVTQDGQAVLVDFGLAKIMQGSQATSTGARAMTPGYSPPEQYGTAHTGPRSDIYSLGATLYAAMTGVIPEDSLGRLTGNAELTPVRELAPRINKRFADAIERALEIDPDDRYQSAEEFKSALVDAGELSNLFQERPTITPPPESATSLENLPEGSASGSMPRRSSRPRNSKSFLRKRMQQRMAWVFVPAFVILISLAVFAVLLRPAFLPGSAYSETQTPSTPANSSTTIADASTLSTASTLSPDVTTTANSLAATPSPQQVELSNPTPALVAEPSPTPTPLGGGQAQIAFASDRTGVVQVWMMNIDGSQQRQLTNVSGGACQPSWSPDGMQIVFTSPCPGQQDSYPGSALYILNLADSKVIPLPNGSPEGDYDPAWSPDGNRIAFTTLRKGKPSIFVINLETQSVEDLSRQAFDDSQPAWMPGGMQLAFLRKYTTSQIWVMSDTGQYQAQFSKNEGVINMYPNWSNDGTVIYYSETSSNSFIPWLAGMRYEDRKTAREFRVPPKPQTDQGPVAQARISPDGFWFTYESWPDGTNHDIFIMKANGTDAKRLTTDPGVDFGPTWRPLSNNTTIP